MTADGLKQWEIEEIIPSRNDDGSIRTLTVSWRCITTGEFKCITFDSRDLKYIREVTE